MGSARDEHREHLRRHHGPAHARRRADRHAAFLLPHLRPGMRVLDIGCGPATITVGLADAVAPGAALGIDLDARRAIGAGVPVAAADAVRLPFPDGSFDAMFACAALQHIDDPLAVLREARRVARPGAVIAIADADWDGFLVNPDDPLLHRGQEILRALKEAGDPTVGKQLRELLVDAGFERVTATATAASEGDGQTTHAGETRAAAFEAPSAVALAVEIGASTPDEMAAIAGAWRAWGRDPGAFFAGFWVEALGWVDGG